ncbi:MAG: hypothetical protein IPK52_19890 [Chloroflexi bacterium]|nr:hypothetical protein [Chloroflexota bacterium]
MAERRDRRRQGRRRLSGQRSGSELAAAAGIVISVVIGWRDLAAPVWICGFLYLFLAGVL